MNNSTIPTEITLHKRTKTLELTYGEAHYLLPAEYLRVYSPSAEVKGHGPGQEVLQTHKENVAIDKIEPVGQYAIKIYFDDGHDSGLYSWDYLHDLAVDYEYYWQDYLQRLAQAGYQRQSS